MPRGADLVVQFLERQGVSRMFCVPGESFLSVMDAALDSSIEMVTCRHEANAANMAEATGKLTSLPGVAWVTRGPGATHASIAVHTAHHDSTPMLLCVGQVPTYQRGRDAFQETELTEWFAPLAKWTVEVPSADRVAEFMSRAWSRAIQGRPGPVVVSFPEDVLSAPAEPVDMPVVTRTALRPTETTVAQISHFMASGNPSESLIIAGGTGWNARAWNALRDLAQRTQWPVATSFRRKDLFDNHHAAYVGDLGLGANPSLVSYASACKQLLILGARMGENPSQGFQLPSSQSRIVHVHPDPHEIGRLFTAEISACADPAEMVISLASAVSQQPIADQPLELRRSYEAWTTPKPAQGPLNPALIVSQLTTMLPDDSIVTNGAGNYAAYGHRYHQYRTLGSILAPTSGAMGYGLPAGIAACLEHPSKRVVTLAGDGCLMMASPDLCTATTLQLNLVVLLFNNSSYGTIRMHQERHYPGRIANTNLANPDFVMLARANHWKAMRLERDSDIESVLSDAFQSDGPVLIECVTDVVDISPGRTI